MPVSKLQGFITPIEDVYLVAHMGVARVEVSTDGGVSWREATLEPKETAPTWQRFALSWDVMTPGTYEIRCRATDSQGRMQPNEGRNSVHAITVTVV